MKLWTDDGRTDDGRRTTEPAYTISSPGAFGSGELKKLTKSSNSSFGKHCLNRRETAQLGLLTLNSGKRRNLFPIQIGSRKDLMIRLGSIIGFPLWKTWRQRNLHHVFQRELLCAYLLNKNRSNLLLHVFNT